MICNTPREESVEVKAFDERLLSPNAHHVEDVGEVILDGVLGDVQSSGYLSVGDSAHDEVYNLPLTGAQAVGCCV